MLFRSISSNSTKSLKLMWKPSTKSTGQNKLLVQSIQDHQSKFIIDGVGFDADELYNEKLFDNLANKAKETVKRTKNQHRLMTRRLKRF